jgi:hypothetical protein
MSDKRNGHLGHVNYVSSSIQCLFLPRIEPRVTEHNRFLSRFIPKSEAVPASRHLTMGDHVQQCFIHLSPGTGTMGSSGATVPTERDTEICDDTQGPDHKASFKAETSGSKLGIGHIDIYSVFQLGNSSQQFKLLLENSPSRTHYMVCLRLSVGFSR